MKWVRKLMFWISIIIQIKIDVDSGEATFDFEGTGTEVWGNINAPKVRQSHIWIGKSSVYFETLGILWPISFLASAVFLNSIILLLVRN